MKPADKRTPDEEEPEKLTQRRIEGYAFKGSTPQSQDIRWDADLPGFGVRVFPSGAKSFVIHYRSRGRQRLHTIGKVGILTLKQAQDKAKIAIAHRNEVDPADTYRAFLKAPTFGNLADTYLKNHAAKKRSYNDDKRRIDKKLLPKWKNRKLESITHNDVIELHRAIGAEILKRESGSKPKHYEANRTLALIRSMFNRALAWGMLKADHRNPATGIAMFEESERERWIQDKEMKAIAQAIGKLPNAYARGVLWLAFLTGMRKEEVLTAQWSQFDPKGMTLTLPTTKNGRPHVVAITTDAKAVIESMPKREDNPYIFCGRVKGRHLVNISKPWNAVKKAAKTPDVRIHDIRRTVGSWLAQQGESIPTIKALLNHSDMRTTLRYTRSARTQERQALETTSRKLRPMIGSLTAPANSQPATQGKRRIRLRKPETASAE